MNSEMFAQSGLYQIASLLLALMQAMAASPITTEPIFKWYIEQIISVQICFARQYLCTKTLRFVTRLHRTELIVQVLSIVKASFDQSTSVPPQLP